MKKKKKNKNKDMQHLILTLLITNSLTFLKMQLTLVAVKVAKSWRF